MAIEYKTPVALFSLEMPKAQIMNRLISNVSEIPSEKLKNGSLASYEREQLDFKMKDLIDVPIHICNIPIMTIDDLCEKSYQLVKEQGVKLIVVDYIQLLYNNHVRYGDNSRYPDINYFTRRLKSLAMELNIPIIILSQMKRNSELRVDSKEKRPQLIDLRDSGTLCDDSDIVIFIHRPEYYKIFTDDKGRDLRGIAEIIIAKHRNGAEGEVKLRFIPQFTQFSDLDDGPFFIPLPDGTYSSRINSLDKDNSFLSDSKNSLLF
ncbi:MAG: DnaB-like helicase C-terminal domain-containing protein [Bacteroides sp.]|nr:DnaB-like helicase C-terminal domain-containing protein [Bacteroides sp.]